jgi:hypothetical protein
MMKKIAFQRITIPLNELQELENQVAEVLRPVQLRPAFVQDLQNRLYIEQTRLSKIKHTQTPSILLVIAAVISGVLLVLTGIRAIVSLIGLFGLIKGFQYEMNKKQGASPEPIH